MNRRLALYAAVHFLVDLSCALVLLGRVCPAGDVALCLLLYNFLAFAGQMPLGLLADRLSRNHAVAAAGCLLAAGAFLLPPLPAVLCAGMGNALFHVGGGLDTLNGSKGPGALGLFVAPGALGIALGGRFALRWDLLAPPVSLGLLLAAALLFLRARGPDNAPVSFPKDLAGRLPALLCLFLVVVLRSWVGLSASFPWSAGLWMTAAVVLGKAGGGFLAERLGLRRTAAGTLGLAALCFLGAGLPLPGLLAVFLFNMTMPLTLWGAAKLLPGCRGFAFGLLTFGLFLGFLPDHLGWGTPPAGPLVSATAALLSLPPLLWGLRRGARVC